MIKRIINKIKWEKSKREFKKYMYETVKVTYYYYNEPNKVYTEKMNRIGLNNMGIYEYDLVLVKVEEI